jgi:predicted O-methyltransferase YrrM
MKATFGHSYLRSLDSARMLLKDFGNSFQPISMATSAQTGALLAALAGVLGKHRLIETGSGFSSAMLPNAIRVENNDDYGLRVRSWLARVGVAEGSFCGYDHLHGSRLTDPFLLFLDGDLAYRERTSHWLQDKLAHAVVLIDDAQPGTFAEVQAVIDTLKSDARGRLLDCSAWTHDEYGRSAALWVGNASQMPAQVIDEIVAGPPETGPPSSARLLMCISDTPGNARWECTVRALTSVGITANLQEHSLWIVDNGSTCPNTARFLDVWCRDQLDQNAQLRVFRLSKNMYATYAFNRLLAMCSPGDYVIRLENDIEYHSANWPATLMRFLSMSGFGLVSAKPVDLPLKAQDVPAEDICGVRVQVVTEVAGFCTAISPSLRLELGAFACAGRYIEDVITSRRAISMGFRAAFVDPAVVRCFHVDRRASDEYHRWKQTAVKEEWEAMTHAMTDWGPSSRSVYVPFEHHDDDGFHEVLF